jgi:hypothetical protein
MRALSKLGVESVSVLAFLSTGSSLSVRAAHRIGASTSLCGSLLGAMSKGFGLSVLDCVHLGSSLSIRPFFQQTRETSID